MARKYSRRDILKGALKWTGIGATAAAAEPVIAATESFSRLYNAFAGQIYKWRDANGQLHFSDVPVEMPEEYETIESNDLVRAKTINSDEDLEQMVKQPPQAPRKTMQNMAVSKPSRKYNTVLHEGLDMQLGARDVRRDYKALDKLIDLAKRDRDIKKTSDKEGAIKTLKAIAGIVDSFGHTFKAEDYTTRDCKKSFIYFAIGQEMGLPIYVVEAPVHYFVRMKYGGKSLNWETTANKILSNSDYFRKLNISRTAIKNGVHLSSLGEHSVKARMYEFAGKAWRKAGNYDKAIEMYNSGLSISPRSTKLLHSRGCAYGYKEDYSEALADFGKAIKLDPNYKRAYKNRAIIYKRMGNYSDQREDMERFASL